MSGHPHKEGLKHSSNSPITPYPHPSGVIRISTLIMKMLLKYRYIVVILAITLLFAIANASAAKRIFFIVGLTILGSISTFYKIKVKYSLGVELCTLATVLCSIAYGPIVGMFVGIISSTLSVVIPQMVDATDIFYILSYALVGLTMPLFYNVFHWPMIICAMIAVLIIIVISEPLRLLSGSVELKMMAWIFIFTSVVFNLMVFSWFAKPILSIMLAP